MGALGPCQGKSQSVEDWAVREAHETMHPQKQGLTEAVLPSGHHDPEPGSRQGHPQSSAHPSPSGTSPHSCRGGVESGAIAEGRPAATLIQNLEV